MARRKKKGGRPKCDWNKGQCRQNGCDSKAVVTGLCGACYQWFRSWMNNRTPSDLRRRAQQIDRLARRMDTLTASRKIVPLRRKSA